MTILTMIQKNAIEHPHKLALTALNENIDYATLWLGIENTAGNLDAIGVSPGDKMLFSVKPSLDSIVFAMGVIAMGATVVFVDLHDNSTSWERRLELMKPDYIVADTSVYALSTIFFKKKAAKIRLSLPEYAKFSDVGFFHIGMRLMGTPRQSINVKSLAEKTSTNPYSRTGDEPSIAFFTPSTTGNPQAIMHSLNTLSAGLSEVLDDMGINSSTKAFSDHFMFGVAVLCGGGWWALPRYSSKHETIKWFNELLLSQWTHSFMIPADIATMLSCIRLQGNTPEIENLFTGAAPVLPDLAIRAGINMPRTRFHSVYGMKEVFPVSIIGLSEKLFNTVYDYAGLPLTSCNVSICEPNSQGIGEIVISGPSLMLGYVGEPPQTEYRTGDSGMRMPNGALLLLGQQKEVIQRNSRSIYPGFYEPLLDKLEGIEKAIILGVELPNGNDQHMVLFVSGDDAAIEALPLNVENIMGAGDLPDTTIRVTSIPRKGRSAKPDREKLREIAISNPYTQKKINERKEQL